MQANIKRSPNDQQPYSTIIIIQNPNLIIFAKMKIKKIMLVNKLRYMKLMYTVDVSDAESESKGCKIFNTASHSDDLLEFGRDWHFSKLSSDSFNFVIFLRNNESLA